MSNYEDTPAGGHVSFEDEGARAWRMYVTPASAHTLRRFERSNARVRGIMGPVGSGKTTKALLEGIRRTALQVPGPDGVARARFLVIRRTYRDLWRSTIASWVEWVPRNLGTWIGGKDQPAEHRLRFQIGNREIQITVQFVAIGDQAAEDALRGYEATFAFLDEADLLSPDVVGYLIKRLGRYPKKDLPNGFDGPSWYGLWMCFNAPNHDNWLYQRFFERKPRNWELFIQPGGRTPEAENVENLPNGYYDPDDGAEAWEVARLIDNKPGFSRAGQPVFTAYNDALHCGGRILQPWPGAGLILGFDAGATPACVFMQRQGRAVQILKELYTESTHARAFGEEVSRILQQEFSGLRIQAWGDPSAAYQSDTSPDPWLDIVASQIGVPVRPTYTNAVPPRLEAWKQPLSTILENGKPALSVSADCRMVRAGLNHGYRYARNSQGKVNYDRPEKNEYSHPIDAGGYGLLGTADRRDFEGRRDRARPKRKVRLPATSMFNPFR